MSLADLFDNEKTHHTNEKPPSRIKKEFIEFCSANNGKITNDSEYHLECSFENPLDVAEIEVDNDDNELNIYVTKSRSRRKVTTKLNKITLPKETRASLSKEFNDNEKVEDVCFDGYYDMYSIDGELFINEIAVIKKEFDDEMVEIIIK